MIRRGEIVGRPDGWTPQAELDHFEQCPICGGTIDCRDLAQVLEHLHGQEIEWLESTAPGA